MTTATHSTDSRGTSVQGPGTPPIHTLSASSSNTAAKGPCRAKEDGKRKECAVQGGGVRRVDEGSGGSDGGQGGQGSCSACAGGGPGSISLHDLAARQAAMEQKVESYGKVLQAMRNRIVALQVGVGAGGRCPHPHLTLTRSHMHAFSPLSAVPSTPALLLTRFLCFWACLFCAGSMPVLILPTGIRGQQPRLRQDPT
eukprot:1136846-Pelagomonas_calceolata.AAC.1